MFNSLPVEQKWRKVIMQFKRIFLNYVTKYFIGFFIAFICSILVVIMAHRSIEDNMINRAEIKNQEAILDVYEAIEKMELTSQLMRQNSTFTELANLNEVSGKDVLLLREANRIFKDIGMIADYIVYAFILFENNDAYLSTNHCSQIFSTYYNQFLTVSSEEEFVDNSESFREELLLCSKRKPHFLRVDNLTFWGMEKVETLDMPVIYVTNGDYAGRSSKYVFGFVIDYNALVDEIMLPELEGGFLYISDADTGLPIVSYGPVPEDILNNEDKEHIYYQKETYHIFEITQNELRWNIITGLPMSVINQQVRQIEYVFWVCLCLGVFIVIGLTLVFSLNHYNNLLKLMQEFPIEEREMIEHKSYNDQQLMIWNIQQLKEKGADYLAQIDDLRHQNHVLFLQHLLLNGIRTTEEKELAETILDAPLEFFCIAKVEINNYKLENFEVVILTMIQFFKQEGLKLLTNIRMDVKNEVFLIKMNSDQEANTDKIKLVFQKVADTLFKEFSTNFHIGISAVGVGLNAVNRCYEQSSRVVQAQYIFNEENRVEVYDVSNDTGYENPVDLGFLNRLYTLLTCGQAEQIHQEFQKIVGFYDRMPFFYESQKEQIFYSIRNVFYIVLLHLKFDTLWKQLPSFDYKLKCDEMMSIFERQVDFICANILEKKKSKNEVLKQKLLDYLHDHYNDSEINAYTVSQELGISEKYLFQFMKEQTGQTFANYLLYIRIERAKELLRNTNYSNEQIAYMIGFVSVNTFYRNFSKITGVTPKIYKEES